MGQAAIPVVVVLAIGVCTGPFAFAQEKQTQQSERPAQEQEKKDTARRRSEWFYNQRAYPLGRIPAGARLNALRQLDEMLVREGKLVRQPDGTVAAPAAVEGAAASPSANPWTPLGPQPTGSGNSATAGRVTAIAVDPANPDIVADQFRGYGGTILSTTLSRDQQTKVERVLSNRAA